MSYILAIESSCDDTSAAVCQDKLLLSNVVAGQKVHEQYGGVVPELASRAHQQNIVPVVDAALKQAGITKEELSAIAYTRGPGLTPFNVSAASNTAVVALPGTPSVSAGTSAPGATALLALSGARTPS